MNKNIIVLKAATGKMSFYLKQRILALKFFLLTFFLKLLWSNYYYTWFDHYEPRLKTTCWYILTSVTRVDAYTTNGCPVYSRGFNLETLHFHLKCVSLSFFFSVCPATKQLFSTKLQQELPGPQKVKAVAQMWNFEEDKGRIYTLLLILFSPQLSSSFYCLLSFEIYESKSYI